MRAYERFMKYITFDTASCDRSETCPSTEKQKVLGAYLAEEMKALGIADARMDEFGYVYGSIPANVENQPAIGLIAHMDVVDCVPCTPMNARIVKNYDGKALTLESGDVLDPELYKGLKACAGKDLIVTDGRTILGADDKAGIAEILTLAERLMADKSLKHGKICIGFTPDEEIGEGASLFDVPGFGAAYAYTVDGEDAGEISYENFNAAAAVVTVHGFSVHPGSAKNTMINAQNVAMEFHAALPAFARPEHTEGREGFFHLTSMVGDVTTAKLGYIVRDHDAAKFAARKAQMEHIAACLNDRYGAGTVELDIHDSYYNMLEKIQPHFHLVENARKAIRTAGLEPIETPVRGGTDGATLSYMGLPCPNLGTGGFNFHGPCECITAEKMDQCTEILLNLVDLYK